MTTTFSPELAFLLEREEVADNFKDALLKYGVHLSLRHAMGIQTLQVGKRRTWWLQ